MENIHSEAPRTLTERGHRVTLTSPGRSGDSIGEHLRDAHVLGVRSKTQISEATFEAAPDLIAVGCFCIGTDQVDLAAARRRGIVVFNSPFSNTRSVAELTIAEVIALHRRLGEASMNMHRGVWDKSAVAAHDVRGRTLGIIGYGHIGSQASVLAEALGMQVVFYDIVHKLPIGNARALPSLESVLSQSDVVTLHVPETETTRGMIGKDEIAAMRPGSFLINNARGSVVDVAALAEAVRSGHLGGAAADVFPDEPPGSRDAYDSPLAGLPNVILTPHIGGSTEEAQKGIAHDVATKLLRFMETGSTLSAVNVPEVDLPQLRPKQHRILHFHHNVPGVLSRMHRLLADLDININAEYLQSDAELSYVILDIDATDHPPILAGLESIPETIRVRTLL